VPEPSQAAFKSELAKLAASRPTDDPLAPLARTVLHGQLSLRETAAQPWHGQALQAAFTKAQQEHQELSAEQREQIDATARQLQAADDPDGQRADR
jgi:hypothetical protein